MNNESAFAIWLFATFVLGIGNILVNANLTEYSKTTKRIWLVAFLFWITPMLLTAYAKVVMQ